MADSMPAPAPPVRLVPELLDFAAREYGDAPFVLRFENAAWRGPGFRIAARQVAAFAGLLARQGVRPGARVALDAESRPEWGLAYLSILAAGAVAVPLDPLLTATEVGEILASAAVSHAVGGRRQLPSLRQVRESRLPSLALVSLDPGQELPDWEEAQRDLAGASPPSNPAKPDDLAVLIFTSGTSGRPKGVMLSHSNLLHNVEACVSAFRFSARDRFLSVLPIHHAFECTAGFLSPLRAGSSIAYARSLKSNELRQDLSSSRATIMLSVPLLYEHIRESIVRGLENAPPERRRTAGALRALARVARRAGLDLRRSLLAPVRAGTGLGSIRLFVSGAAPLPPDVFAAFDELGFEILEGYGLSECSPVVAANRPGRARPGTVGPPLPGIEVRIDAPDEHGEGEILVRGPNLMLGYLGNPEATAETIRDGWLHTGDLGAIEPDGSIRITGRLKNMIATAGGKKIYPEEIEVRLAASPLIREIVVVGERGAGGEEVHAHVVPNREAVEALAREAGRPADEAFFEETLRAEVERLGQSLAPFKRVRRVIVRGEEFPRTSTGKIRREGLSSVNSPSEKPPLSSPASSAPGASRHPPRGA